jgi:hypothetical protein
LATSKTGVIAGGEGSKYIGLQAFFDLGKTFRVTAFKRLAQFSMRQHRNNTKNIKQN